MLRFLKIITSVKCVIPLYDDSIVPPKEGEFHRKFSKAWSANIDKRIMLRGLQLLWDK